MNSEQVARAGQLLADRRNLSGLKAAVANGSAVFLETSPLYTLVPPFAPHGCITLSNDELAAIGGRLLAIIDSRLRPIEEELAALGVSLTE